jgi:transcriptional regulator with XRE-family HTH domain
MREAQGDTMETFARRLQVALNTVSRWENSKPPTGRSLEKLYLFAKRHGPATCADTLGCAIAREREDRVREKEDQSRSRYRAAQILDPGNLADARGTLSALWRFEQAGGGLDHRQRRELLLQLADRLCLGGRKDLLEEESWAEIEKARRRGEEK